MPTSLRHRYTADQAALREFLAQVFTNAAGMPILVDYFCCQGGATRGYQQAGFYVIGVDLDPQPRYCGQAFIQGDALDLIAAMAQWIRATGAVVHGSPPCQGYSAAQVLQGNDHPWLIAPTRDAFNALGVPWVIENVPGAVGHMNDPVVLCGQMFGLKTYRDRYFEAGGGLVLAQPHHPRHDRPITKMGRPRRGGEMAHYVGNFSGVAEARADLGMPWASRDGLRECIPPAYAEWVGGHLRIRLDGERQILTTHPTWEMEYLPEVTNEQRCEQCGRVGTRGFRQLGDLSRDTPPITVCVARTACRKRWPKPVEIDE